MVLQIPADRGRTVMRRADEHYAPYQGPQLSAKFHQNGTSHQATHTVRDNVDGLLAARSAGIDLMVRIDNGIPYSGRIPRKRLAPVVRDITMTEIVPRQDRRRKGLVTGIDGERGYVVARVRVGLPIVGKLQILEMVSASHVDPPNSALG